MLTVSALGKTYGSDGDAHEAIREMSFEVSEREFVCIVGPSGAGKTTLLKCMSGLLAPTAGEVQLDGRAVTEPPEEMGFVFQDYSRSLLPWLSVRDNVMLPLHHKALDRAERDRLVDESLEAVGLGDVLDRYPWQLSGGMQQRVAIARALAYQPEILLMDEPFASVDAQTRAELEDLVLKLHAEFSVTIVFVTHDIDEAVYLGQRVLVLTGAPSRVQEELAVDLPSPRDQVETKELPEFTRLRGHVYRSIRSRGALSASAT
jgi:NitT/TauT family transport system ATP-binding protein